MFWVTWAFVSGKSPKCIEREGQGRRRTGNRQTKLSEVLKGLKTSEPAGQCVYFFIALPWGSVCRFIFFYKFNCSDPQRSTTGRSGTTHWFVAVDLLTFYIFWNLSTCLPNYLPTHLATFLPTYRTTYLTTFPTTYPSTLLATYSFTYLPSYLPPYLPTHLSTYPATYLPTYLPTYTYTHLPF